jgi:hypothetical protein
MAQTRTWHRLLSALALALACSTGWAGPLPSAPQWKDLSPAQQKVLDPLAHDFDTMGVTPRIKWAGIANRFATMTPDEQRRVQARMRAWTRLSPEQRSKARSQYRRLRKLPGDQRPQLGKRWEEYKSLPATEKSRLRAPDPAPVERDRYQAIPREWLAPPYLRPQRGAQPRKAD